MTTFAKWLQTQENRSDAVGWLAGEWLGAAHRPRVSTPAGIEKHLAEVHTGDQVYIGQLATAVRQAADAYHHRDDPQSGDEAQRQRQAERLDRELAAQSHVERLAAMGPQIDPATGQDRRYQGASPAEIEEAAQREAAAQLANQFDGMNDRDLLLAVVIQQDKIWDLLRTIAATIGINVDDDSIAAMHELWDASPAAAGQVAAESYPDGGSLAAQLAEPTPPQAFATWWGQAEHEQPQQAGPWDAGYPPQSHG